MDVYSRDKKLYVIDIYEGNPQWIAEIKPLDNPTGEPIYVEGQDRRKLDLTLLRQGFEPVA